MLKIVDIVEEYGVQLTQVGERLMGVCPLHNDTKPSFIVYPETNSWFCFSENIGGDVYDFIAKAEKISRQDAMRRYTVSLAETMKQGFERPEIDYNLSLNQVFSKAINRYLTETSGKLENVLKLLEEFDERTNKEFLSSSRAQALLAEFKDRLNKL